MMASSWPLGAREQLRVETAIAHQVHLEPERFLHGAAHVFDRADGHGAEAERHAKRLRRARTQHLAIRVEQARETGGPDA